MRQNDIMESTKIFNSIQNDKPHVKKSWHVYKANLKWILKCIQYIVKNRQTRIKTANNVIPFAWQ